MCSSSFRYKLNNECILYHSGFFLYIHIGLAMVLHVLSTLIFKTNTGDRYHYNIFCVRIWEFIKLKQHVCWWSDNSWENWEFNLPPLTWRAVILSIYSKVSKFRTSNQVGLNLNRPLFLIRSIKLNRLLV